MNAARWLLARLRQWYVDPTTRRLRKKRLISSGSILLLLLGSLVVVPGQGPAAPSVTTITPDCGAAGGLLADVMPLPDPVRFATMSNPCMPIDDVLTWVLEFVPEAPVGGPKARLFLRRVAGIIARLDALNDMLQCGYKTDHLAVVAFRHHTATWSAGLAIGFRGGKVDAFVDTAECFVLQQILPFRPDADAPQPANPAPVLPSVSPASSSSGAPTQPTLCLDGRQWQKDGQNYTMVWLGSSGDVCQLLAADRTADVPTAPASGSASPTPAVPGGRPTTNPGGIALADLALRTGPATWYSEVNQDFRMPRGRAGRAYCYVDGQSITDARFGRSDHWILTEYVTAGFAGYGFVAHTYFDTGGDVVRQIRRCTDREVSNRQPETVLGSVTMDQAKFHLEPSTGSTVTARLPAGMEVEVICYAHGESVSLEVQSDLWVMAFLDKGSPGFIWAPYLDTHGEVTSQVTACVA